MAEMLGSVVAEETLKQVMSVLIGKQSETAEQHVERLEMAQIKGGGGDRDIPRMAHQGRVAATLAEEAEARGAGVRRHAAPVQAARRGR